MAKLCKRMKALNAKVEANKLYTAVEALELIKVSCSSYSPLFSIK